MDSPTMTLLIIIFRLHFIANTVGLYSVTLTYSWPVGCFAMHCEISREWYKTFIFRVDSKPSLYLQWTRTVRHPMQQRIDPHAFGSVLKLSSPALPNALEVTTLLAGSDV